MGFTARTRALQKAIEDVATTPVTESILTSGHRQKYLEIDRGRLSRDCSKALDYVS